MYVQPKKPGEFPFRKEKDDFDIKYFPQHNFHKCGGTANEQNGNVPTPLPSLIILWNVWFERIYSFPQVIAMLHNVSNCIILRCTNTH